MAPCCPPARGCNAQLDDQPCALRIFMAAARSVPEAGLALTRWEAFQRSSGAGTAKTERRFRRRAYERARERALSAVAIEYAQRRRQATRPRGGSRVGRRTGARGPAVSAA
jgi:hypothetical protein